MHGLYVSMESVSQKSEKQSRDPNVHLTSQLKNSSNPAPVYTLTVFIPSFQVIQQIPFGQLATVSYTSGSAFDVMLSRQRFPLPSGRPEVIHFHTVLGFQPLFLQSPSGTKTDHQSEKDIQRIRRTSQSPSDLIHVIMYSILRKWLQISPVPPSINAMLLSFFKG